jgi:hypothetical protein
MKQTLALMVCAAISAGIAPPSHGATPGLGDGGAEDQRRGTVHLPAASDPGPAQEPEPKSGQGGGDAEPATATPQSGQKGGDAEAAPAVPPPPSETPIRSASETPRPAHGKRIAIMPRFAYRLGGVSHDVAPAAGYGLAGTIEVDYVRLDAGLEAAVGVDFSFDRFATSEQGTVTVDGAAAMFGSTRVVSETSFVAVHTAAVRIGAVRPYVTLGAGFGLGYFDSAALDLRPGTAKDAHLLGRAAIGLDVALGRVWSASVRADYTAVRGISPFVTDDGRTLALFGDLFDLDAGIAYRF